MNNLEKKFSCQKTITGDDRILTYSFKGWELSENELNELFETWYTFLWTTPQATMEELIIALKKANNNSKIELEVRGEYIVLGNDKRLNRKRTCQKISIIEITETSLLVRYGDKYYDRTTRWSKEDFFNHNEIIEKITS